MTLRWRALAPALIAFAVGVGMSTQTFINSRLAHDLGSAVYAGVVNNALGVLLVVVAACIVAVPARIAAQLRRGWRPRWWQLFAGINGGLYIAGNADAAPQVGLALVTVAVVCGLLFGGVVVDRIGLGPTGRQSVTFARAFGVLLAIGATIAGVRGSGELRLGVLALVAALGAMTAVQQAAMGRVSAATGEPLAAAVLNLVGGLVVLSVIALATHGVNPPRGWSTPHADWLGGILAALCSLGVLAVIGLLGVLRLMLGLVAGQTLGALALDIVAPVAHAPVTGLTFASVAITIAAVYVSGLRRGAASQAAHSDATSPLAVYEPSD